MAENESLTVTPVETPAPETTTTPEPAATPAPLKDFMAVQPYAPGTGL